MKDLLFKEFKLAFHPSLLIFPLLGALLLVPSYFYFFAFIYLFIGIGNMFMMGRGNQDILFSVLLPVRKRDTVKARVLMIVIMELIQIVLAVPFAIIAAKINPQGNSVGIDANIAFFGFLFGMYALFNVIFLTRFYQTGYKIAMGMFLACAAVAVYILAVEASLYIFEPVRLALDTLTSANLAAQVIVLAAGIAVFIIANMYAYKKAADNLEKVDL